MKPDQVAYPPLDVLKPVADDIWIVDSGPIRAGGVPLPIRMTVIRLPAGGLMLLSPTGFGFTLKAQLEELGPVEHLVAPNSVHWTFVKAWQTHLPNAVTWAAPGLRKRGPVREAGVNLDRDLGAAAPAAWADVVEQVVIPGAGGFAEVAFFHKPSRTLVLTDLVQNLETEKLPMVMRPFIRLAGSAAPLGGTPIYLRAVVKLKGREAKAAAGRLVAFEPQRVVFTHGRWFERDGAAQLRRALAWMLG